MKKIETYIVDDEENAVQSLSIIIQKLAPELQIVGTANHYDVALEEIKKKKPQLLFLDIQLHSATGFDLLSELNQPDLKVIFVTAFDHFAVKAFQSNALDYLLKPVDMNDFTRATQKAVQSIGKSTPDSGEAFLQNLRKALRNKLPLANGSIIEYVDFQDIVHIVGEGSYSKFELLDGSQRMVSHNIGHYEKVLGDSGFLRIHRSHLINAAHIKMIDKGDGGSIQMINGFQAPIARSKKSGLDHLF